MKILTKIDDWICDQYDKHPVLVNFYGSIYRFFRDIPYNIKRLKKRIQLGFYPEEAWNLDYYIAKFTLPRLKHLRANLHSHPIDIEHEQWEKELDLMIFAMEYKLKVFEHIVEYDEDDYQKIQYGFELFGKRFQNLWD